MRWLASRGEVLKGPDGEPTRAIGTITDVKRDPAQSLAEVDVRPRNVVVLQPGMIPKTPSGKLRRAHALALVN